MIDQTKSVTDAFKQLTEHERVLAYMEIEKVWLAPYAGPNPIPSTDEPEDEDCQD